MVALAASSSTNCESGVVAQEGDGADHFIEDHQRRGHDGTGVIFGDQRIAPRINLIPKLGAPALHRFQCNRRVAGAQALSTKAVCLVAIGFRPDQFAIRRPAPEVGAAGAEKLAREAAKQLDQLAGIRALKGGAGEVE